MEKKICDKHNKKIIVVCIYSDCVEPLLCNDCFKDHHCTHPSSYLSYEDNINFDLRINDENFNLPLKLNKERKQIFNESTKSCINRYQKMFIELSDQFESLIQDFSNFKDDATEEILSEIKNENLTNDSLKNSIRKLQRIRNVENEIFEQKKIDSSFIDKMNVDFERELKFFK